MPVDTSHAGPPLTSDVRLLLALCPMLAVTDTLVHGIAMGIAIIIAMTLATLLVAVAGRWLSTEARFAALVLIAAFVVSVLELLLRAALPELHLALGVFLPLVAVNLIILSRLDEHGATAALGSVLKTALGIAGALLVIGVARELVGRGSIFHIDERVPLAGALETSLFRVDMGFLLAMLPPGAFIALGLLLAARNRLSPRAQ
jgi:electron transport complex protein RnfE